MTKKLMTLVVAILGITVSEVKSQNYLFEDGSSGFHAAAQLTTGNFENIVAILPGYTFGGKLTLGLDFGKGNDRLNFLNSTIIRPNVGYLLVKQDYSKIPISINLEGAYQYNILPTTSENTRAVQFGIGIYHELVFAEEEVKLIPQLVFIANRITSNALAEDVTIVYKLGLNVVWRNYYVTPSFLRNNGLSAISLNVGVMFGHARSTD